ncbi:hypothetical protein HanRHA438_Chr08g0352231 [Helianthus annuus]|nr:hypothetical protein HanRHA438_Chr08g0352231 [Helianthus annuus]
MGLYEILGKLSKSKLLSKYSGFFNRLKQIWDPVSYHRELMYAYFANINTRSSASMDHFSPRMEKIFSSSVKKTYDALFAWAATDVNARALLSKDPKLESRLASETQSSAESQLARDCMLSMLENLDKKDLKNMLSCFLEHNPEILKVLFRGGPNSIERITMENIHISFPKMIATIADEYEAQHYAEKKQNRLIALKINSDFSHAGLLVNVSDLGKETLKVFICDNSVVVIGKVVTPSRYGQVEKDIIKLCDRNYDFNQATAEITEEGELRISYPIVYGEAVKRPMCMQLKLKQMDD